MRNAYPVSRRQFLIQSATALAWLRLQKTALAQGAWSPEIDLMYYPWYGGPDDDYLHWRDGGRNPERGDIAANFFPKKWPYSSKDQKLLKWHCRMIRDMGVRRLVLSYWGRGSFTDKAIPYLMHLLPNYGLTACFHIESFEGRNNGQRFKTEIHYLLGRYGGHPAFYRDAEGRPLFYVWAPHLPPTQLHADHYISDGSWQRMLDELRNELGPTLYLAQSLDLGRTQLGHFSGLYFYGPFFSDQQVVEITAAARQAGLVVSGSASPGYDDRRAHRDSSRPTIHRAAGQYYRSTWDLVRISRPDRINITSFNEWHEGTQIEPARRGYRGMSGYSNYDPAGGMFYVEETKRQIAGLGG